MSTYLESIPPLLRLSIYAVVVVAATVLAALWPASRKHGSRLSHVSIPLAAGVMLGAAFFHMLPEAVEAAGASVSYAVAVGIGALFLLERFVLVHACEILPEALAGERHLHHHHPELDPEVHAGAGTLGLTAWLGFSIHTLSDGIALGAGLETAGLGPVVLLAIVLHKIPMSFSLAGVLRTEGRRTGVVLAMVAFFAAMVPVGAAGYLAVAAWLESGVAVAVTPYALAFSVGTFLYISFSDLLPEMHRQRMRALPATGLVTLGIAVMFLLTRLHVH